MIHLIALVEAEETDVEIAPLQGCTAPFQSRVMVREGDLRAEVANVEAACDGDGDDEEEKKLSVEVTASAAQDSNGGLAVLLLGLLWARMELGPKRLWLPRGC
ncbi:hypothetical protein G7Y89_g6099 [Cudoniella acicularis]|uniref:Uncharacterized protein n=1 Tax=Cudoniella acicularis TaxID=354080 RepID=A0A8H4RL77_9HELO|nr:hypothetical protein G7Y89_g6099 [Cudoniella acicularis]